MRDVEFPPEPMDRVGKVLYALNLALLAAILCLGAYAYVALPEVVPTHFGPSGEPTAYGPKYMVLVLAGCLAIAPAVIVAFTGLRFTLLNKYPYLINMPAFYAKIPRLPRERRGVWVNRYFKGLLGMGAALSAVMLAVMASVYVGMAVGKLTGWLVLLILSSLAAIIAPFYLYLRRLSRMLDAELASAG